MLVDEFGVDKVELTARKIMQSGLDALPNRVERHLQRQKFEDQKKSAAPVPLATSGSFIPDLTAQAVGEKFLKKVRGRRE